MIHVGDALTVLRTMPDESVHCVVTSPPYWGLRDYGVEGQLGLERTPEEYLARMVEVFREVRRVLRSHGTAWVNMGDSYASGGKGGGGSFMAEREEAAWQKRSSLNAWRSAPPGLKHKDLVGIPWRFALALQADGWYLRADIIWHKPNPMPESVTDRPTKAHEYVFLLSKSARYFYDGEAVREGRESDVEGEPGKLQQHGNTRRSKAPDGWKTGPGAHGSVRPEGREAGAPAEIRYGRNARSVWTIATEPFPLAHFATFPQKLAERCIRAGTSERGCCPECGAPCVRVVERTGHINGREPAHVPGNSATKTDSTGWGPKTRATENWRPTCDHGLEPEPCTVLDPFAGAGTTLLVAAKLNRRGVGIELKPEYAEMAERRIRGELPLFVEASRG